MCTYTSKVLTQQARERAIKIGRIKGADALSGSQKAVTRVPRGTTLVITPRLDGFEVNPTQLTIAWWEDIQDVEFSIRATNAQEGPVRGEVEITASELLIGLIPLVILVRPPKESPASKPPSSAATVTNAKAIQTVFASHARVERDFVHAYAELYKSLGVYTVIDTEALIGGEPWEPGIQALMQQSDSFQLFWSQNASVSPNVRSEIEDAVRIQADRGLSYIRPCYWEEPPPPLPASLEHLNFAFIDKKRILQLLQGSPAQGPPNREQPLAGSPRIPVAVLPLLPGTSSQATRDIRTDVAYAVHFIESTLGERYFPVPTLLVDRHTIRGVRTSQTIDLGALQTDAKRELVNWAEVLAAICLAIHVSTFWDNQNREAAEETANRAMLSQELYDTFRRWCEAGPRGWLIPSRNSQTDGDIPALSASGEPSSWMHTRDAMAIAQGNASIDGVVFSQKQPFLEFAASFFNVASRVLRQRASEVPAATFENGYSIPTDAWHQLQAQNFGAQLTSSPDRYQKDAVRMQGTVAALADALDGAWSKANTLLQRLVATKKLTQYAADIPTFGIFAPASAASVDAQLAAKPGEWGIPPALFLPGTDRVLLCATALDEFGKAVSNAGAGPNMARLFLRALLIHEHFHAFAYTAPLKDGAPPPGPGFVQQWNTASCVNEALAAWMQVHFARDQKDPQLSQWFKEYNGSGEYPHWPYAGASRIEKAYQTGGLQVVQNLANLLRTDPPLAVAWMRDKAPA